VSFFSKTDETIRGGAFTIVFEGTGAVAATDIETAEVTCYDASGATVAAHGLDLAP
jgi:hypothetical protein